MTRNKCFVAIVFAAVSLLFSHPLAAQTAAINGQIEGTVTDASGAAITTAQVKIANAQTGFTQSSQTNTEGFYRFNLIPLGTYSITISASGFGSYEQRSIPVGAGAAVTINATLGVAGTAQTIEVSAGAAVVDPGQTDIMQSLSLTQLENLPLVSRNPFNFILLQPNVAGRPNTEFGVPRKINANGFNGRINYQIDGSNNTESDRAGIRLLPLSDTFIQEIAMVNNGFAPEFGNTVGTIFNTITKSGTNDLHGEGAYLFRRTDFSARPALLAYTRPTPETNVDTFFGNAGGSIVKDKLFYFGGVEHVKRDLPTIVSVAPSVISQLGLPANYADAIPFSQNVLFFLGRLDYQINNANRLSVRFNGHRNDSPYNNGGGLVVVSQTYNFIDRSYAGALQLVSSLSPTLVNEFRAQLPYRLQSQNPFAATGTGPSITIPGVIQFGGSPNLNFLYKEVTPEFNDGLRYTRGNHTYSAGFGFRAILDREAQSPSATYTFPSVAAFLTAGTNPTGYTTFIQGYGQPSLTYNTHFYSAYLQDNWKLRRNVTLIYGVRYEFYQPPDPNSAARYEPSRNFHTDDNNLAPRLGVAIGLGKEQKTVIRASTGVFYDPPQTDQYRRAILNNGSSVPLNISLPPSSPFAPAYPAIFTSLPAGLAIPPQDVLSVAPDFANLYSFNANVSLRREIARNTGVTVTYLYTRGNRLPVYRNINLVPNGTVLADGRPVFGSSRVDARFNNVSIAESVGQSTYNGGTVTLNHRLDRGLDLFASYTWSHAIDNAPEQNNIDSASQGLEDPTNRNRDKGNSLTDRRNSFALSGVYTPPAGGYLLKNNEISFQFVGYSGDIFNIGSNRNLNGDTSVATSLQRPLFIGRNTYRGPATYQLDLRYTRLVPIGERIQGQIFAEFTNLLNHTNVTGVNTTATVDATGAITAAPSYAWTTALDQRLLQLGFRVRF